MLHLPPDLEGPRRTRLYGTALMVGVLLLGIIVAIEALAHHPGSHAKRMPSGAVRLDAAVVVPDACTTIDAIEAGAPAGRAGPKDAAPFRVTLSRPAGTICAQVVSTARRSSDLSVAAALRHLHLYVISATGDLAATERVRID